MLLWCGILKSFDFVLIFNFFNFGVVVRMIEFCFFVFVIIVSLVVNGFNFFFIYDIFVKKFFWFM